MSLSQRSRREWRMIVWVSLASAAVSAWFGIRVAPPSDSLLRSATHGVITSLIIATPILLVQVKGATWPPLRRLRRLPLVVFFALKSLFYFVVIVGGLLIVRLMLNDHFGFDEVFRQSVIFAIIMSVVGNLLFDMGGLLGFGTLKNLLTGRYVQPRHEQRAFLLIDMKNSTGLAERLGPIRFHELLNDFFRDVADAALECAAEIHKYVGDEAILTWPDSSSAADSDSLNCPFIARDLIARNAERYRMRYGTVPEFRAALHRGEIVAGEIGDVRREIAYVGDTLNVAARLLDTAKASGHDVLVSADLLARTKLPADLKAEPLPVLEVRGRAAPISVSALAKVGTLSAGAMADGGSGRDRLRLPESVRQQ